MFCLTQFSYNLFTYGLCIAIDVILCTLFNDMIGFVEIAHPDTYYCGHVVPTYPSSEDCHTKCVETKDINETSG